MEGRIELTNLSETLEGKRVRYLSHISYKTFVAIEVDGKIISEGHVSHSAARRWIKKNLKKKKR